MKSLIISLFCKENEFQTIKTENKRYAKFNFNAYKETAYKIVILYILESIAHNLIYEYRRYRLEKLSF